MRLRRTVGDSEPTYRYERDVEQFFRHSPAVLRDRTDPHRTSPNRASAVARCTASVASRATEASMPSQS